MLDSRANNQPQQQGGFRQQAPQQQGGFQQAPQQQGGFQQQKPQAMPTIAQQEQSYNDDIPF